ncbi:HAMP domain-containing sensor histidine kinase [Actimicrobium sp. CCI2.3]|uniref:HAMP domain-containing sensor histidine kinase n=1 Tax=Actimicrobium sp. CCI2.3 TaxID=3048616 RepID=UPI002AB3DADC|nr:HAMP domain-containing sensor histidine kinase [Actimicrobium sp. CCI2.3]MDY7576390.1 HAMP domain-containing sensor histidine kinase [Actimicrobium sp. CCI2.3]MEB0020406.1 HAMP domain-containing sensor histidine kinase [Actimicrobium sp. CCI2.3]
MLSLSRRLYVRIYLALLLALGLTAALFAAAWQLSPEKARTGANLDAFAEIASEALPPVSASLAEQQAGLARWRPRADLTLYSAERTKLAEVGEALPPLDPAQTSSGWLGGRPPVFALQLEDGRWLVGARKHSPRRYLPMPGLAAALALIALAVGLAAFPVVRRLTRRLERLQQSVEALGAGQLSTRVAVEGNDEVAQLASSFNRSAAHIEILVQAQRSLLANASHELRSPLARLRMAVELLPTATPPTLQDEMTRDIAELDQLIAEILLASRLDATTDDAPLREPVDLTALVADESTRAGAQLASADITLRGDATLLRRMVRNLLDNARRYGEGSAIDVTLRRVDDAISLSVCDRGPGVPEAEREKIFAAFYRLPGGRERDGGIGLGLSLVRQIARRHGGDVTCLPRGGGGSCFVVTLPQH